VAQVANILNAQDEPLREDAPCKMHIERLS
jgi:hypothetical protein